LGAKLLLGESQVALGCAGAWTKQEFCDKKGSPAGDGEPVQPASRLGSRRLQPCKAKKAE